MLTSHTIPPNEEMILLDMSQYGLKNVIVQTNTKEIRETLERLEDTSNFSLQSLVHNLIGTYRKIDNIYPQDTEERRVKWSNFMDNCVIYACWCRKRLDKPFKLCEHYEIVGKIKATA